MRVRVALRAFWAMWDMRHLFSINKFGFFSWQLMCHKVLRYGCFFFLLLVYFSNLLLWSEGHLYKLTFCIQNLAYLAASLSPILEKRGSKNFLTHLCYYFTLLNFASAHAFYKFLIGHRQALWTPRKG
jgi:hypothetical protein